jgi:hypothetical protein
MLAPEHIDALSNFQIRNFFKQHPATTQAQCDMHAQRLLGTNQVAATPVQGMTSYTVVGGNTPRIVQFRRQGSLLDVDVIDAAANTYGPEFIPSCEYLGMVDGVHVYLMSCVGGSALSRVQRNFFVQGAEGKLYVSVRDMARSV